MLHSTSQWQPGELIQNRFRIVRQLGAGGMGEVYLAEDNRLWRKVALKLLPAKFTMDVERLGRFQQEACATSALNHPNIITIFDIGQDGSTHFIATEFIEGETLRQRISAGKLSISEALNIAVQVASALSAAHSVNVVHRDVKPENIMLRTDGHVKILDFGLAKLTNARSENAAFQSGHLPLIKTEPGVVLGTPGYMSPEQACGESVDRRTDIFSLGVVLYEMITGHRPFDGKTVGEIIAATLSKEPQPLKEYAPEVSDEIQRVITTVLCKDRESRHQTADELVGALKRLCV